MSPAPAAVAAFYSGWPHLFSSDPTTATCSTKCRSGCTIFGARSLSRSPPSLKFVSFAAAAASSAEATTPGSFEETYAQGLLAGAQARHKIFREEFIKKAFLEAERAHRGQMRASGDPYLQHCVETAALLAEVGAGPAVVAAGLLHDAVDDAFLDYDRICRQFGPGVADQ